MQLDVASREPAGAHEEEPVARDLVAVVDDEAKLVRRARLAVVDEMHAELHVDAVVGLGPPADVARVRVRGIEEIAGDLRAAEMPVGLVIDDVHMAPEIVVLAAAVGAEVHVLAVILEDEAARGDEVTGRLDEMRER